MGALSTRVFTANPSISSESIRPCSPHEQPLSTNGSAVVPLGDLLGTDQSPAPYPEIGEMIRLGSFPDQMPLHEFDGGIELEIGVPLFAKAVPFVAGHQIPDGRPVLADLRDDLFGF